MESQSEVTVYSQRDNSFYLILRKDGKLLTTLEMDSIIKYEIHYNGSYYNSIDHAAAFVADTSNSKVLIKPYSLGLAVSEDEKVEFLIYDAADYSHGVVWDTFKLTVLNDAIPAS